MEFESASTGLLNGTRLWSAAAARWEEAIGVDGDAHRQMLAPCVEAILDARPVATHTALDYG
ncbi:hypothetical protein GCM10027061_09590 [Nesterenkonia suensis]